MRILFSGLIFIFGLTAHSENLVQVEPLFGPESTYQERNPKVTTLWSIQTSNYYPTGYLSPKDGNSYKNLFGPATISMTELSAHLRRKLGAIDFGVGLSYAAGGVSSNLIGDQVGLALEAIGLSGGVWLNGFSQEPLLVPFGQILVNTVAFTEADSSGSIRGQALYQLYFKAGLQVQLNKLEPDNSDRARQSIGLENTFLDVYAMGPLSKTAGTINLTTDFSWGAGISLEF